VRIPWVERGAEKNLVATKQQLDPAAFQEAWECGRRLTPDAAVAMAKKFPPVMNTSAARWSRRTRRLPALDKPDRRIR
jgi:hypothetical protein